MLWVKRVPKQLLKGYLEQGILECASVGTSQNKGNPQNSTTKKILEMIYFDYRNLCPTFKHTHIIRMEETGRNSNVTCGLSMSRCCLWLLVVFSMKM